MKDLKQSFKEQIDNPIKPEFSAEFLDQVRYYSRIWFKKNISAEEASLVASRFIAIFSMTVHHIADENTEGKKWTTMYLEFVD